MQNLRTIQKKAKYELPTLLMIVTHSCRTGGSIYADLHVKRSWACGFSLNFATKYFCSF